MNNVLKLVFGEKFQGLKMDGTKTKSKHYNTAKIQKSFASVIRDKKKELSQAAKVVRNGNATDDSRRAAIAKIKEIDSWISDPQVGSQGSLPLGASATSNPSNRGSQIEDLESLAFSRTGPELAQQRKIHAQQGPNNAKVGKSGVKELRNPTFPNVLNLGRHGTAGVAIPKHKGGRMSLQEIIRFLEQERSKATNTSVAPIDRSIPAPRNTTHRDNVVSKVQRGVNDRQEDGFSMTENMFDQLNIDGEIAVGEARYGGRPIQNKHIPGTLDADDPVLDMVMGVQKWQDGKIFIANSNGQSINVNDLTENSLMKLIQDPVTKDIMISPVDIERLP